ncbi:MAG: acyl-CoA dehydrogenase family protein, partial [Mangrovicoccus sp.]
MPHDGQPLPFSDVETPVLADLLSLTAAAVEPTQTVLDAAKDALKEATTKDGRISGGLIEKHQHAAHGLAWLATYVESLRQMNAWAVKLDEMGKLGELEQLLLQISFGEYLSQIDGGIPMWNGEFFRIRDMGLSYEPLITDEIRALMANGNSQAARVRLVELMLEQRANTTVGFTGLDEELEMIREQFRRYAVDRVEPNAHEWHLKDELIPMEIIEELAEMGVFGLTIPEEY